MDRLDKISILLVIALTVSLIFISRDFPIEAEDNPGRRADEKVYGVNVPADMIKTVKNLIESNNMQKAEMIITDLIKRYPYAAESRMLMGDLMMRRNDPVSALLHYREAVELNPDYLDKKTLIFQGYKIKVAMEEAEVRIKETILKRPEDRNIIEAKKNMYYLLRRLAGSCG